MLILEDSDENQSPFETKTYITSVSEKEKFNRRCKMKSVYLVMAGILSVALAIFVGKHLYPTQLLHQLAGTLSVVFVGSVLYWLGERLWEEEKKWARLG